MKHFIITGIAAGMLGTLVMDVSNHLFSRFGLISRIDIGMIGRMSVGWVHGRFRYHHPSEMTQVTNERLYGYIAHYVIGIGLALIFVLSWNILIGGPVNSIWVIAYGMATTLASYLLIYPSMGLGVFGLRSPDGIRSTLSSLVNHFCYGLGMAVALMLV